MSYDTKYTYQPTCPHCGYLYRDAFELDDEGEAMCSNCEKEFSYTRNTQVTYSTAPLGDTP